MMAGRLHPDLRTLVERCTASFRSWAGREGEAIAFAPGRVNLIGEHTDYNDGFVLPMAINRWCVAVGRRVEGTGRVLSEDLGETAAYEPGTADVRSLVATPWAKYPVGVLWTMRAQCAGMDRAGVEMAIASSVPLGGGLSSSAALELAVGSLADRLFGLGLSPTRLAEIGRRAEHEFAGVPCGIMDQLISACASPGAAMLIDCRTLERRGVQVPKSAAVVVADSGVRHALAGGEYAKRRESCRRAAAALGVPALRDANLALLAGCAGALSAEDRACARHVITENERVLAFELALSAGDVLAAGRLMGESHASLRDEYRVSCPELDALVERAMAVPGVLGSRMTGGGFGGCTVTLCRAEAVEGVLNALGSVGRTGGRRCLEPFVAVPVGGACAWMA